jgi:hypothetical protein
MSSFKKSCTFCGQEIVLSNDSGRWLPRNLDNTFHECKNKQQSPQQKPQQQAQAQENLTLESIDKRLKKIEYTLFGT